MIWPQRILQRSDRQVTVPVVRRWTATLLAIQLAILGFLILATHGAFFRLPHPCTTDFVSFFAAGKLANGSPSLAYDRALHFATEQQATSPGINYVSFFYPPVYLLICGLLARMSYLLSFVCFEVATLTFCLLVLRSIVGRECSTWWLAACAFSPLIWNVGIGQNACLTAGLLGGGTLLLHRQRPIAAGFVFSCLFFKPHAGLLVPIALAASRSWRAFAAAALGVCLLVAATAWIYGWQAWLAFLHVIVKAQQGFSGQDVVPFEATASAFGAARMLGAGAWWARAFEAVVTVGVIAAIVWSWRKPDDGSGARNASLAAGTVLIMPIVLFYDTVLLLVSAAWLFHTAKLTGLRDGERIGLAAVWLAGLICYPATKEFHVPIAFTMALATFALATVRQAHSVRCLPESNEPSSLSSMKGLPLFGLGSTVPDLSAVRTVRGLGSKVEDHRMLALVRHWVAFKFDRRGVTALEYAIIAGLVGAVVVGGFTTLGSNISTKISAVAGML